MSKEYFRFDLGGKMGSGELLEKCESFRRYSGWGGMILIAPGGNPPPGWIGTWTPQEHYGSCKWIVYILLCSDGTLYTGITTDIKRRFGQHQRGRGAKYFRGRQPLHVVYLEQGHTRSSASKREAEIKALSRADKDTLILHFKRKNTP